MKLAVVNKRACGECRACCTTCAVVELHKPFNSPCAHLVESGCGIYESRPNTCRVYDCAWLQGYLAEKYRPDRSGIVWTFERIASFDGLLVHAMLTSADVPLDRVEYLYEIIKRTSSSKLMLQIIPHDLRLPLGEKIAGRQIKPGVYLAVEK